MKFVMYFFINLLCMFNMLLAADRLLDRGLSSFEYSVATQDDIPNIMGLYDSFTDDDNAKVLVFPREVREARLLDSIKKQRMFVAKDTSIGRNNIVSFCKVFFIENQEERQGVIFEELGAAVRTQYSFMPASALVCKKYLLSHEQVSGFSIPLKEQPEDLGLKYSYSPRDLYLYYGGAYTVPAYRKLGVNTALERYALGVNRDKVMRALSSSVVEGLKIYYIYGVVEANYGGAARFRSFASFIESFHLSSTAARDLDAVIHLNFYAFRAFKPCFYMDHGELSVAPGDDSRTIAGKGYGCFIEFKL